MDKIYLEREPDLRKDLINFCKANLPTSKAEKEIGTRFEYTDKFIDFIVEKSFKKANDIENFPSVMQDLIGERKKQLIIHCNKASDIMMEGHFAEYPLVFDYDEKRGTLLKFNNRTLRKHMEAECVSDSIKNIRSKNETNTKSKKLKNT